jgi:nucleoside-triphosphatase THEP1
MLKSEKILRREDGSRVRIIVRAGEYRMTSFKYMTEVHVCKKGKRTWFSVTDINSHEYRRLSSDERDSYVRQKQLEVVTEDEILQAKLKLWETLKPKKESEDETK